MPRIFNFKFRVLNDKGKHGAIYDAITNEVVEEFTQLFTAIKHTRNARLFINRHDSLWEVAVALYDFRPRRGIQELRWIFRRRGNRRLTRGVGDYLAVEFSQPGVSRISSSRVNRASTRQLVREEKGKGEGKRKKKTKGLKRFDPTNLFIVPTFPAQPRQIALDDDPWNNTPRNCNLLYRD